MKIENPLFEIQREKSGSTTFGKYLYQYHWALYRILKEHDEANEYALFVELHEDVVLANSLNVDDVKFEFNQVKTTKNSFTKKSITKLTEGNSVLGKLISSTISKTYNEKITDINLVATSGFNTDFVPTGVSIENISINDIARETLESLSNSITKELSIDYFPINIHFITSKVPDIGFQDFIIGNISKVVSKLFPGSLTQAESIYRSLIDELSRKGMVTDDYQDWNELLKNKALTSITVEKVINEYTQRKENSEIKKKLDDILNELNFKTMKKSKYVQSFDRYYLNRIGSKTLGQLDIKKSIEDNLEKCDDEIEKLIEVVSSSLPDPVKNQFSNEIDIQTAIICEYILKEFD